MMQTILPTGMVLIHENQPITTSLKIAEYFEKEHRNVLRDIQNLTADCPDNFNQLNFEPVEYIDAKGEKRPMYYVHFDGFMLLAMGYTGKKALKVKLAYIEAFNTMRKKLEELANTASNAELPLMSDINSSTDLANFVDARINKFFSENFIPFVNKAVGAAFKNVAQKIDNCADDLMKPSVKKQLLSDEQREFVNFVKANSIFFLEPRTAVEIAEKGLPLAKESPKTFVWWLKRNNFKGVMRKGTRSMEFNVLPLPEHLS